MWMRIYVDVDEVAEMRSSCGLEAVHKNDH